MARRLVNTTLKNMKDTFTFELWDMESVAANLDHTVEFDVNGFEIDWRGSEKDSPFMASTCKFNMYLTNAQRSAIMPVVFDGDEFQLCVCIKKGGSVWWAGMVHAEQVTEVIEDGTIAVSFSASDGLGMLNNIDWKDDNGDRYNGEIRARDAIWGVLKRLPHMPLMQTGAAALVEHSLIQPITGNSTLDFSFGPVGGNYYGVLDHLYISPDTFYYSNNVEESAVTTRRFGSMDRFNPDDFSESGKVLTDIMTSLGTTICFADGAWHVFDKTERFYAAHDDAPPRIEYYVTQSMELDTYGNYTSSVVDSKYDRGALAGVDSSFLNNPQYYFAKGAAIKGSHPVRGVTQKHVNAGSDLLYANGIGYFDEINRANWEIGEGLNTPLIRQSRPSRYNTAATDGKKYGGQFKSGFDASMTWDGVYNTRLRNRHITGIQIPNGNNEGEVRIHIAGNCDYTHRDLLTGAPSNGPWGTLGIFRQRVEIYDGTYWYRLSRPVRTITHSTAGVAYGNDIDGSGAGTYYPKFYTNTYDWIRDDESEYADAWLMIPLGANNSILEGGTASRYLQTDYPDTEFFTPPLTKVKTGEDNILEKDNDRTHYVWRHDFVYEMPAASGTIEELKMSKPNLQEWNGSTGPNRLNSSSTAGLPLGHDQGAPSYSTAIDSSTTGLGNKPNAIRLFQLSGCEVFFGDGTQNYDQVGVATPDVPQGKEIMNLQNTRLGASFVNFGGSTNGRYRVSDYQNLTSREDNIRWRRPYDPTFIKESSPEMVANNFLQMRHKVRRTITGELFYNYNSAHNATDQILLPFERLVTDQLDSSARMIVPYDLSYTLRDGRQRFNGYYKTVSAESNIAGTTEDQIDESRGPNPPVGNLEKPSGTETDAIAMESGGTSTGGDGGTFGDIFPIFIKRF